MSGIPKKIVDLIQQMSLISWFYFNYITCHHIAEGSIKHHSRQLTVFNTGCTLQSSRELLKMPRSHPRPNQNL